jgi:hypothetical protein
MRKLRIVLRGDHGGELDSRQIEIREEQDESAVIGNAVMGFLEEWTLNAGDTIAIEQA